MLGAVASTIHQKVKFIRGASVITIFGDKGIGSGGAPVLEVQEERKEDPQLGGFQFDAIMAIKEEGPENTKYCTFTFDTQGRLSKWTKSGERLHTPDLVMEFLFLGRHLDLTPPQTNLTRPNPSPPSFNPSLQINFVPSNPNRTPQNLDPQITPPDQILSPNHLVRSPTPYSPQSLTPYSPQSLTPYSPQSYDSPQYSPQSYDPLLSPYSPTDPYAIPLTDSEEEGLPHESSLLESDSEDEDYVPTDDEFEADIKVRISKKEVMGLLADACTEKRKRGRPRKNVLRKRNRTS